jgi:uncharacterized RmlC-like cupin family protein
MLVPVARQALVTLPGESRVAAVGEHLVIHEWEGSGPAQLHVHHVDDEAWHVLAGQVRFRFADREMDVTAGSTVFVPAGVPHSYEVSEPGTRYLIILTPRLAALIAALQGSRDPGAAPGIYREHRSELLDS